MLSPYNICTVQTIRRALIVGLAMVAALLLLASLALRAPAVVGWLRDLPLGPLAAATPPPPVIAAQAGPLPDGTAGLTELAQRSAQAFHEVGSGFVLRLPGGAISGVTTAHSLSGLGQAGYGLEQVALQVPGATGLFPPVQSNHLYGSPGAPFSGDDLSVDYVLLALLPLDPPTPSYDRLALTPDPRGGPQPGERVALFSGLDVVGDVAPPPQLGTVLTSSAAAAWVLMDESFDPNGMSGSPVLSTYTGQVVGMAVAASRQHGRLLIGLNPIGAIVAHGLAAHDFPLIAGYTR